MILKVRFRHYGTVLVLLAALTPTAPAEAGMSERLDRVFGRAQQAAEELAATAEQAILIGGAAIHRNRHTIAGAALGCAAGSVVGAGSAAALGPVTAGATLTGAAYAALLGCGFGAVAGAQIGYPLDHVFEED